MWVLMVIINTTYVTDLQFQEFTSKSNCEAFAHAIKTHLESAVVICKEK